MNIGEMTSMILDLDNKKQIENFFVLAWIFCYRTNKWVHEKCSTRPQESLDFTVSLSKHYKTTTTMLTTQNLRNKINQKIPPPGFLKLNVDGALFYTNNKVGLGDLEG